MFEFSYCSNNCLFLCKNKRHSCIYRSFWVNQKRDEFQANSFYLFSNMIHLKQHICAKDWPTNSCISGRPTKIWPLGLSLPRPILALLQKINRIHFFFVDPNRSPRFFDFTYFYKILQSCQEYGDIITHFQLKNSRKCSSTVNLIHFCHDIQKNHMNNSATCNSIFQIQIQWKWAINNVLSNNLHGLKFIS